MSRQKAIVTGPPDASAYAGFAQSLLNAGNATAALAAADAAIQLDPRHADALQVRGYALRRLGRLPEAADAWEHALAHDPHRAGLSVNLGILCAGLGRMSDAEHRMLRAIEIDPELKEAHASLGALYAALGRHALAERHCATAVSLDPTLVAAHRTRAAAASSRGDRTSARRHLSDALALRSTVIEPASSVSLRTVLVPLVNSSGNVPLRYLLPRTRNTLIKWGVEFAKPGDALQLPAYDVAFNGVGDADQDAALAKLSGLLPGCDRPILNSPDRISATRRDRLPALLGAVPGVLVPAVLRVSAANSPAEVARQAGWSGRLLVRPAGSHGGDGVVLIESQAGLDALPSDTDRYVTAFQDYRSPDGLWRKYRAIFVAGMVFPYHLAVSDQWLVHYWTAGMEHAASRREEERRFLENPAAALGHGAWDAVAAMGRTLGLDWGGIDFARHEDGRVIVFEANATMNVHPEDSDGVFAYKNPAVNAILDAFETMLQRTTLRARSSASSACPTPCSSSTLSVCSP